jgi:hypothetical protein
MRRIAIRLLLFAALLVIGALVFIAYRMSQPPALLGIIPAEVKAAGFIDTRNIVKKTFEFGGLSFENIPFPDFLTEVFSQPDDLKEPGINLYSEIVWFEHNDGFQALMCKLARPENWESYVAKKTQEGYFDPIQSKGERHCVRLKNQNAFFAWRGKILCLVFTDNEQIEIHPETTDKVLFPEKTFKHLNSAYKEQKPDLFYIDVEGNTSIALRVQSGMLRFYAQKGNEIQNYNAFENINAISEQIRDTSLIRIDLSQSQHAAKLFPEFSMLSGLSFPGLNIKAELKYFNTHDDEEPVVRFQSYPADFDMAIGIHAPVNNKPFIVADIGNVPVGFLNQLTDLPLENHFFDRILIAVSQQNDQQIWQGTMYLKDTQELPLEQVGSILVHWLFSENRVLSALTLP